MESSSFVDSPVFFTILFGAGPVFFVVLALPILLFLAKRSGWTTLAERFRAKGPVRGESMLVRHSAMGREESPIGYGKAMTVTLNDQGFGVSMMFVFRLGSPPLFIPWAAVEKVTEKEGFVRRSVVVHLRDQWPVIALAGDPGERLRAHYIRMRTGG